MLFLFSVFRWPSSPAHCACCASRIPPHFSLARNNISDPRSAILFYNNSTLVCLLSFRHPFLFSFSLESRKKRIRICRLVRSALHWPTLVVDEERVGVTLILLLCYKYVCAHNDNRIHYISLFCLHSSSFVSPRVILFLSRTHLASFFSLYSHSRIASCTMAQRLGAKCVFYSLSAQDGLLFVFQSPRQLG